MEICKCSDKTLERIINDLSCDSRIATQSHIKKGGYHNLEVFYDDYLVKLIQAKLLSNQANQGRASDTIKEIVKSAVKNEADWTSKKELADMCRVDEKTIQRVANDILKLDTGVQSQSHIKKGGYHNSEVFYDDYLVKLIQAKLLSNQANQGRASEVVKQATMDNLEIGVAANYVISSGSIEAAQQFAQLLISRTEAIAKSKQLESENQQLVHALEYDEVVGWKKWSELKKELAQNFELLRHKINYTKLFDEVGLVENEDYKKKVMGFDKFPTVLISPEAEDMLWDWLDGHH